MAELKITAANFENEVLNSDKPVLLDFYADWCGPCKMLAPVIHEIAEENIGALKVGKINVDEQMELAMRFQVSSIPMLVVFKDGKAVAKSVGYRPKSEIAAMVEERSTRKPLTNCSSHPAQSRRFLHFPAWTASGSLPCAPWKTPFALDAL